MIAGIAGGLGTYLGVDPVLVRLAIVALTLAGGAGILAYLIAWLIIPEEPHPGAAVEVAAASPETAGSPRGIGARVVVGVILIGIGALLLVQWALPWADDVAWPLALIGTGLGLLIYGARR